ncbi:MAG TPA: hypothetical protein VKY24_23475 [Reyranella sp.]|nr:hypothetical protein [Reyranella sp.]
MTMVSMAARSAAAVACAFTCVCGSVPATAQTEDDRLTLFRYYIAIVASDVCDIDVSKAQEKRFNQAVETLEKKVGASKAEMDTTFKQIKEGATNSPKGFWETDRKPSEETVAEFK